MFVNMLAGRNNGTLNHALCHPVLRAAGKQHTMVTASMLFSKMVELKIVDALSYDIMMRSYARLGLVLQANRVFREGCDIFPMNSQIREQMIELY
eukprot:TRINITY_DN19286_c0_g1_i1.p1 TRINITY_DN19286_c0_g1~~TRINITY_DN19286_c0_g1_i1.p1  ORF type:complete len:105 (-),score=21.76 TRINITY_DN19286_c0_g1_i1:14-298(-)